MLHLLGIKFSMSSTWTTTTQKSALMSQLIHAEVVKLRESEGS